MLSCKDQARLVRVERTPHDAKFLTSTWDLRGLASGLDVLKYLQTKAREDELGTPRVLDDAICVLGSGATSVVYELKKGWLCPIGPEQIIVLVGVSCGASSYPIYFLPNRGHGTEREPCSGRQSCARGQ